MIKISKTEVEYTSEVEHTSDEKLNDILTRKLQLLRISLTQHPVHTEKHELRKSYFFLLNYGLAKFQTQDPFIIEFLKLYVTVLNISCGDKAAMEVCNFGVADTKVSRTIEILRKKYYKREKFIFKSSLYSFSLIAELLWIRNVYKFHIDERTITSLASMLKISSVMYQSIDKYISYLKGNELEQAEICLTSKPLRKRRKDLHFLLEREESNMEQAKKQPYEAAIIATMSAGKSTLLNALVGKNLVPSRNQACTAKITGIHHIDTLDHTIGYSTQRMNKVHISGQLDYETLNEWNNEELNHSIYIEDRMSAIRNGEMRLVLYDTPGSNYSLDKSHYETTYQLLEKQSVDLIIYVINASQIGVYDDNILLQKVIKTITEGKKKTRIIFVLNQVDLFDEDGEDNLQISIDNLKLHLEQQGVLSPEVIPLSSYAVKLFRMVLSREPLTKKESVDFRSLYELFSEEIDLRTYAPLWLEVPFIASSSIDGDEEFFINNQMYTAGRVQKALSKTGFPILEAYINALLMHDYR